MNDSTLGTWTGRLLGGRYEVQQIIGRGGMADVYLGQDARLGRQVAIKILKSSLSTDPKFRERFRLEAMAVSKMSHPSIVRVFDAGDEENNISAENQVGSTTPYIVMEYVRGHLLSSLMSQGKFEERHVLKVANGVLTALEVSHKAGIVHRDIKPANIMISEEGTVKVMDFGIARAVSDATENLEQTTSILGTALYLSPEQARGQEPDTRTDLYSLGVVMYELLAGRPPFSSDSPVSLAYKHISEEAKALTAVNSSVSPDVSKIVETAMKKDLGNRFPSAQSFRAAIEAVAAGRSPNFPSTDSGFRVQPVVTGSVPIANVDADHRELPEGLEIFESRGIKPQSVPSLAIGLGSVLSLLFVIGVVLWVFTLNPSTIATNAAPAVPPLVDQNESIAAESISSLGLVPEIEYQASEEIPEGIVIKTYPEDGVRVAPGEPVIITVSSGIARFNLPDTRNIDEETARTLLEDSGLSLGESITTYSPALEKGLVIDSEPKPDTPVRPGEEIVLTVSNGLVLIPDVVGLTVGEANPFLTGPEMQLSVKLEITTDCVGQTVKSQSLEPGEHPQRSEITLTYCGLVTTDEGEAEAVN